MSAQIEARLAALLAIEEVLGAAVIDAAGCIESCINMAEDDAIALYRMLSAAVGSFADGNADQHAPAPSFATFALREGQIAFSSTPRRALLVLTDPDLQSGLLKALLHEVLAELALTDHQLSAQPPAPPAPLG